MQDHLRNHMMQGEEVDEETVEVRSLPLQLTRLLQPILVPIPQSLRVGGSVCVCQFPFIFLQPDEVRKS